MIETTRTYLRFFGMLCLLFFVAAAPSSAQSIRKTFTLVIDPGHGGHDSGAVGKLTKEKTINLNVALALGKLVEDHCPDVKIVYTRKTDVFIPLQQRATIANNAKADLFISIHTNALPEGRIAYGAETYTLGMARANENLEVAKRENSVILYEQDYKHTYSGFDPRSSESYIIFELMQDQHMKQSVSLAGKIQHQYVNHAKRRNKGVHQAGFLVLRATSMPSVLTELGFISTPEEEQYLHSAEGVRQMAQSIFNGFVNYKREREGLKPIQTPFLDSPSAAQQPPKESPAAVGQKTRQPVETMKAESVATATAQPAADSTARLPEKAEKAAPKADVAADKVEFRVQILTSPKPLRQSDSRFKGREDVSYYIDGNTYKYTVGSSADINDMVRLRRTLAEHFPECFVIALQGGKRIDVNQARTLLKKQ